jgi:DNA invertase Pin-like site-specific DNA recombinase
MVLTVLGMVAEMELGFIRDRQRASIEAARRRGFTRAALSRSTAPALCPCASWNGRH